MLEQKEQNEVADSDSNWVYVSICLNVPACKLYEISSTHYWHIVANKIGEDSLKLVQDPMQYIEPL